MPGPNAIPLYDLAPAAAWARASARVRAAFLRAAGAKAVALHHAQMRRGLDRFGRRLKAVKPRSRPDGATGPPLDPHYGDSRTVAWLRYTPAPARRGVTLHWPAVWARILGFHRAGAGRLPVRDVTGLAPAAGRKLSTWGRAWWRGGPPEARRAQAPAPPAAPPGRIAVVLPPALARTHRLVEVSMARLVAAWREGRGYYIGVAGRGVSARRGAYADAKRILATGRVEAPVLAVGADGSISIGDGRHRLAALRDAGVRRVEVAVRKGDVARVRRRFGR